MMEYDWFKKVNMKDVENKKLQPPFQTDNFEYNFDDSEFAED